MEKKERLLRSQQKAEEFQDMLFRQHRDRMEQLEQQKQQEELLKEQWRKQIYQKCMIRLQQQTQNKQVMQEKARIAAQSVAILEQSHQRSLIAMQKQWQRNEHKLKVVLSKKHLVTEQQKTPNLNYAFVMSNDYVVRSQIKAENSEKSISSYKRKLYAAQFRVSKKISLSS